MEQDQKLSGGRTSKNRPTPGTKELESISRGAAGPSTWPGRSTTRVSLLALVLGATLLCGCQQLTYTGPNGERFARVSFGATTAIGLLAIETDTNGVRRVELRGYQNDSTQALGVVTEAAVRAALQPR